MEFYAAGSLDNIMIVLDYTFNEEEIAYLMQQCLEGLAYLHERRKIHRDIKPGNIMMGDVSYNLS